MVGLGKDEGWNQLQSGRRGQDRTYKNSIFRVMYLMNGPVNKIYLNGHCAQILY